MKHPFFYLLGLTVIFCSCSKPYPQEEAIKSYLEDLSTVVANSVEVNYSEDIDMVITTKDSLNYLLRYFGRPTYQDGFFDYQSSELSSEDYGLNDAMDYYNETKSVMSAERVRSQEVLDSLGGGSFFWESRIEDIDKHLAELKFNEEKMND